MRKVRWTKTLEGNPCAFPNVGEIKAGEEAWLTDDEVKVALDAGLATVLEPQPTPSSDEVGS